MANAGTHLDQINDPDTNFSTGGCIFDEELGKWRLKTEEEIAENVVEIFFCQAPCDYFSSGNGDFTMKEFVDWCVEENNKYTEYEWYQPLNEDILKRIITDDVENGHLFEKSPGVFADTA